jgi:RNA polymerase sigma-70 factor (ECF subfamily)
MPFVPFRSTRQARSEPGATAAESALVRRIAEGDAAALDRVYRQHAGPVYRYVLHLCANPAWAADATQDAFVALAQRPEGFDGSRGGLGGYLAGIARHALAARWRQAGHESPLDEGAPPLGDDDGPDDAAAGEHAASPEAMLVRRQDSAAVQRALMALPAVFREALVLVDVQERPYAEAARIAGVELNTLRTRLHRARHKLAAALNAAGAGALA